MVSLSREEQDKMIAAFIEKYGATRLPPDARITGGVNESSKDQKKGKKKPGRKKKAKEEEKND